MSVVPFGIAGSGVAVMTTPGRWLRELREELHLTRSAVERLTGDMASRSANERYRIRRGRLTDIEEDRSPPDIFEVESLCECCKVPYSSVLEAYGVRLAEIHPPGNHTHPPVSAEQGWTLADADPPFSSTFQNHVSFDTTRLVTESAEELGIPAVVRSRLDNGHFRLGIIGLNDDTMNGLVPAGSVVVIDKSRNDVEMGEWKSILERPIYFVWHERGYSCSWCNVVRDTLFIVPHPTSQQPVMIFKMPRAATVIGRVIHVWPPLVVRKSRVS
jgi:transcriptional regulator with XRE-family HTH domain